MGFVINVSSTIFIILGPFSVGGSYFSLTLGGNWMLLLLLTSLVEDVRHQYFLAPRVVESAVRWPCFCYFYWRCHRRPHRCYRLTEAWPKMLLSLLVASHWWSNRWHKMTAMQTHTVPVAGWVVSLPFTSSVLFLLEICGRRITVRGDAGEESLISLRLVFLAKREEKSW